MAIFITRVELQNATQEDYLLLYENMGNLGFLKIIESNNKIRYYLPHAEYYYNNRFIDNEIEVLEKVKNIAKRLNRKYSILVTKASSVAWFGLDQIK